MLFEDKEQNLLEDFRLFSSMNTESVYLVSDTDETRMIIRSIIDDNSWHSEWIDSSSKSDPPPDFYNKNRDLMLEVMRVDDHSFEEKGRIQNPTNQKARAVEKELREKGFLDNSPNARLFVNSPTDLPSSKDHDYRFYKDSFKRIIEKHKGQIHQYRENHPGYKLIFFVYDESSIYCRVDTPNRTIKQGERIKGIPHYWFYDKTFLDLIRDSGIDFFIWFTPYKLFELMELPFDLPRTCVYDCNHMQIEAIEYPEDYMMSLEE